MVFNSLQAFWRDLTCLSLSVLVFMIPLISEKFPFFVRRHVSLACVEFLGNVPEIQLIYVEPGSITVTVSYQLNAT